MFLYSRQQGFTLFEVLVSISIFIVILGIAIANIMGGNNKSELRLRGLEVVSNIRDVQNDAITILSVGTTTPRAWGVRFVEGTDSYKIFAKTGGTDWRYSTGDVVDVKIINLGRGYSIPSLGINDPQDIDDNCNYVEEGVLDIVFSVPVSDIYFNGLQPNSTDCGGGFNPALIQIQDEANGLKIDIEVNWVSGRISASDIY